MTNQEILEYLNQNLDLILNGLDIKDKVKVNINEENFKNKYIYQIDLDIQDKDAISLFIGKRGIGLKSIQQWLNAVMSRFLHKYENESIEEKPEEKSEKKTTKTKNTDQDQSQDKSAPSADLENETIYKIMVDINDYNKANDDRIIKKAEEAIEHVKLFEEEFIMPPLNPRQRRLVHLEVEKHQFIKSESFGDKYDRRLIISPIVKEKDKDKKDETEEVNLD